MKSIVYKSFRWTAIFEINERPRETKIGNATRAALKEAIKQFIVRLERTK